MSGVELKPCPFCGGEAELTGYRAPEFWVHCPQIGCKASTEAFGSKDKAIAAWNTRATTAQLDALREAREALEGMLPDNVCLANVVLPDDALVPLDTTMGELRAVAKALATLTAAIARAEGA
jgi:Lar family restriction alleviation protein